MLFDGIPTAFRDNRVVPIQRERNRSYVTWSIYNGQIYKVLNKSRFCARMAVIGSFRDQIQILAKKSNSDRQFWPLFDFFIEFFLKVNTMQLSLLFII
jgi:hypothetical protein